MEESYEGGPGKGGLFRSEGGRRTEGHARETGARISC